MTPRLHRRTLLGAALAVPLRALAAPLPAPPSDGAVLTRRALRFPRDHGSHPDTAIEWWYVTGALEAGVRRFGFQLTFFRARVPLTQTMRSALAARQLIFAHAALTDLGGGRLHHDQRIARSAGDATMDLASCSLDDTDVQLLDWSLRRDGDRFQAVAQGQDFGFALTLALTQPLLLQGEDGWSRKGPQPVQASFYTSQPQLAASGELRLAGERLAVRGRAWLDHEWSQSLLDAQAVGWDWIGINLDDGGALTAFVLRRHDGSTLWAGGSWRADGAAPVQAFAPQQVQFEPRRRWRSAASGASYPVEQVLTLSHPSLPEALRRCTVRALLDDQELDSRASTGAIYWEGVSRLQDAQGRVLGTGYLELTGYAGALDLG